MSPTPPLGALPEPAGTRFRVYAPDARAVELLLEAGGDETRTIAMAPMPNGIHEVAVDGVRAGARYRYVLDGGPPFPDPVSRYQPLGVHGPSEVVDPAAFTWSDAGWRGRPLREMVLYELHVGTFTRAGTYAAAAARLPWLEALGINTIELMPLHDFPGERNWGYDTGALYAPAHAYGHPDDLRRLIDAAHALGLGVVLDVVYNHLGPDGAYVAAFDRAMLDRDRRTPWGASLNLDGARSGPVREFLIENALYWQREFHIDGFRLDAAHALHDQGDPHLLAEMGDCVRAAAGGRHCVLITEDGRNLRHVLETREQGGHGLDGEWCFDIHHQFHRLLTGERHLYYAGFRRSNRDLAKALRQGWMYTGQVDPYSKGPRGSDPSGIPPWRFVAYLQSHDEIGNRPLGDRLHATTGLPAYRAALALLLLGAQTPMLFMGDEWAAGTPFHFFTDHKSTIGGRVLMGRREFFSRWIGDRARTALERMPDPQSLAAFEQSRLDWSEPAREPHASMLEYVRRLLALRAGEPALQAGDAAAFEVTAIGRHAIALVRRAPRAAAIAVVAAFAPAQVAAGALGALGGAPWSVVLTSEDAGLCANPHAIDVGTAAGGLAVTFARAGAIVLRGAAVAEA